MNIKLLQSMFFTTAVLSIPMVSQVAQAADWHQEPASAHCQTYYGAQSNKIQTAGPNAIKALAPVWVVCSQPHHGNAGGTSNKTHYYASVYHAGAAHGSNCYVSKGGFYTASWLSMINPSYAGYGYSRKLGVTMPSWCNSQISCYLKTGDKMLMTAYYN